MIKINIVDRQKMKFQRQRKSFRSRNLNTEEKEVKNYGVFYEAFVDVPEERNIERAKEGQRVWIAGEVYDSSLRKDMWYFKEFINDNEVLCINGLKKTRAFFKDAVVIH